MINTSKLHKTPYQHQGRWLVLIDFNGYDLECFEALLNCLPDLKAVILHNAPELICQLIKNKPHIIDGGDFDNLTDLDQESWAGVILGTKIDLSDLDTLSLTKLRLKSTPVYHMCDMWESLWSKLPPYLLDGHWFVANSRFQDVNSLRIKRLMDGLISILLLIFLFPLLLLVAAAIKLDSPGKIFYSQLRTGKNGKPFKVYKFRSMHENAEKGGAQWASLRDNRITRSGYWLRILRIDELPQLWNVLKGEMSLIGPRPERPEFDAKLKEVIPYYELRYLIKPGISGWAQVLYRYGASVEDSYEKLAYDLYYIKNYSLWLDLVIFFKTIAVVLGGNGR
jgi:exopolysaccharide biosynthesis polyprenyl glycosylphosphotransferase